MRKTKEYLDYHEGLSENQVRVIFKEIGLPHYTERFFQWIGGQTCPMVARHDRKTPKETWVVGFYEYDVFRFIRSIRTGRSPIFD